MQTTTIYYQGSVNNERLLTDAAYFNDINEIDKDEYDIQPTVIFTVPDNLINENTIFVTVDSIKRSDKEVYTCTFPVTLAKDFGIRQTELQYINDIMETILDTYNKTYIIDYEQVIMEYDVKYFQRLYKTRLLFSVKATICVQHYWLAKLLGAEVGKTYTSVETQNGHAITFDNKLVLNFIKTLHVFCPIIQEPTLLKTPDGKSSISKYLLIRKNLDAAPQSTVTITIGTVATIRRQYLLQGIQIQFTDENFVEIPLTDKYNLELTIGKSKRRQEFEIEKAQARQQEYQETEFKRKQEEQKEQEYQLQQLMKQNVTQEEVIQKFQQIMQIALGEELDEDDEFIPLYKDVTGQQENIKQLEDYYENEEKNAKSRYEKEQIKQEKSKRLIPLYEELHKSFGLARIQHKIKQGNYTEQEKNEMKTEDEYSRLIYLSKIVPKEVERINNEIVKLQTAYRDTLNPDMPDETLDKKLSRFKLLPEPEKQDISIDDLQTNKNQLIKGRDKILTSMAEKYTKTVIDKNKNQSQKFKQGLINSQQILERMDSALEEIMSKTETKDFPIEKVKESFSKLDNKFQKIQKTTVPYKQAAYKQKQEQLAKERNWDDIEQVWYQLFEINQDKYLKAQEDAVDKAFLEIKLKPEEYDTKPKQRRLFKDIIDKTNKDLVLKIKPQTFEEQVSDKLFELQKKEKK
ncbi:Hypothetical_protein [Hexamita inflata]|uniref:Hypothetical_protein n=1 Tax=Hexamita inflata TaxID=28002 RepID=A0AA86N7C3_9EUKA|nr:Hypothetical protein HINF_LOCUS1691 [Hexamita inflata]